MTIEAAPVTPAAAPAPAVDGAGPPAGPADVTPAVRGHVADEQKATSFRERMDRAKSIFAEHAKPKLEGAPAAEAEPEGEAEKPEPAAAKAKPDAEPEKATSKEETAHVRALTALRRSEAENLRLKQEGKTASDKLAAEMAADRAELAKFKAQFEAMSKDPVAALKAAGMTPDQFMRGVVEQKIKPPTPEDALREQMQEKLSPLEQRLAEAEAKLKAKEEAETQAAETARQAQAREKDLGTVKAVITAEEYPVIAALGAYDTVLDACYRSGSQDVAAKAAEFEAHQIGLLENLLTPKVLAALSTRSAKIRETVGALKGSGQSRQTTVSSGGPRVAARDAVSAPTTPIDPPKTDAERMARAKARLNGAG